MFELTTTTECELTQFTGRTQKSGSDDVPAVSFRLKIKGAKNTMLDMLSPTMRRRPTRQSRAMSSCRAWRSRRRCCAAPT